MEKRPWAALECHEKAYRVMVHNPELESSETIWNEIVDACEDLVSAFESLGELPGNMELVTWYVKTGSTRPELR